MLAERNIAASPAGGRGSRQEVFLNLLTAVYDDLHGYVRSLVVNRADGDDVMQEVCVTLWSKFDEFEFGTSFRKWAFSVAFLTARGYWRDKKRDRGWALTDQVLEKFGRIYEASVEIREIRGRHLDECVAGLPAGDRSFVRQIYFEEVPPAEWAESRGLSVSAAYSRMSRLRRKLARCIERKMA